MAATLPRFIAGRLLAAAAVLAGASLACFLTFHVLRPDMFAGQGSFAHQLGDFLDRMFLHGDLGRSWTIGHRSVTDMVAEGLPADASLLIGSLVIGVIAGIAAGAVCAVRPKALISRLFGLFAAVAVCAPVYWVGLVVIFLFSPDIGSLGLPLVGGQGTYKPLAQDPLSWLRGLILPWLVLAAPLAGTRRADLQHSRRPAAHDGGDREHRGQGRRRLPRPAGDREHGRPLRRPREPGRRLRARLARPADTKPARI